MENNYGFGSDLNDQNFSREFKSPEEVEEKAKEIEEQLKTKLDKVKEKISFTKDIMALFNYMKDRQVAWYRKTIVIAALLYFILPIDSIPDMAPFVGYLDDLGVIAATIKYMGNELIPYYNQ